MFAAPTFWTMNGVYQPSAPPSVFVMFGRYTTCDGVPLMGGGGPASGMEGVMVIGGTRKKRAPKGPCTVVPPTSCTEPSERFSKTRIEYFVEMSGTSTSA